MTPESTSGSSLVATLRAALGDGVILMPGDDGYDEATAPDNASFAQQPDIVVRPTSADEVAATVRAAAAAGRQVTVQATGHGAAHAVASNIVLIDSSALSAITIDEHSRTARVGAGATWGQIQAAAEPAGLLGPAGTSPTVGVAGYTVNGGIGWLVRPHGLASAALRAVEYVDGRGEIRRSEDPGADPDALWAFRGGTPIGIATELEFDLFPVSALWAGYLLWPARHLPELAQTWIDCLADAAATLTSTMSLLRLPPQGPFPSELLDTTVVHLSYACTDGETGLSALRAAMSDVAAPAVDTTAASDARTLGGIHLDPPAAVPARGFGEWLGPVQGADVVRIFAAAGVGDPDGLNMIELRHVARAEPSQPVRDGALTRVPGPFLLHTVGAAADGDARTHVDERLERVAQAAEHVSIGRSAPSFRDGQPDPGPAFAVADRRRLLEILTRTDPDGVFAFHRAITP